MSPCVVSVRLYTTYIDIGMLQKYIYISECNSIFGNPKVKQKQEESQSLPSPNCIICFSLVVSVVSRSAVMYTIGFSPGDTPVLCTSRQLEGGEVVQLHQGEEAFTHWHRGMLLGLCCFSPVWGIPYGPAKLKIFVSRSQRDHAASE